MMRRPLALGLLPLLAGDFMTRPRARSTFDLDRWADDGGPIREARDTPRPVPPPRLSRQQRRWQERKGR